MSYVIGYGPKVWTAGDYYFWVCEPPPSMDLDDIADGM
jgi:hypothetical protein